MANSSATVLVEGNLEVFLFRVDENLCGLDVKGIQEVRKDFKITPVPLAPDFVRGVVNLRGDIATVFDLRKRLGLSPGVVTEDTRLIVAKFRKGENVGLLVDRIEDVVSLPRQEIKAAPSHVASIRGDYIAGVWQFEDELVTLLDLSVILRT